MRIEALKQHKYRAIPTKVDGIVFASKKEAKRYSELMLLKKQGLISNLILQPKLPFKVRNTMVFVYRADFAYTDEQGKAIVEDVKGMRTPVYKLKKKLIEADYGIEIKEV